MGIARTNKMEILNTERHMKRRQDEEADDMQKNAPPEPMSRRRIDNATHAHNGFLKWLGIAEMAMHGVSDRELKIGGFAIDRMNTEHFRTLRLMAWEIAVWNLDYFQKIAARYVVLLDVELDRAGFVRTELETMRKAGTS